ncbi:polycystic kidney disease 2-like 1 protein isoform X2 [Aethina tumida]|uniref:polycystic kidney disease 2-like 1 protein isoform X2 n=1 Tax=Aethina tumida TaxID=116153 RepID=UPI0021472F3B|nr:polycystic kidney disease 2-like 1 protein isoform X2 [Aethina tumida]
MTKDKKKEDSDKISKKNKKKEKKAKNKSSRPPFIFTLDQTSNLTRREILKATIIGGLFHVFFTAVLTLYLCHDLNSNVYVFTTQIQSVLMEKEQGVPGFEDVTHVSYIMPFIREKFSEKLWQTYYYRDNNVTIHFKEENRVFLMNNIILGVPRLRQVRVSDHSCIIHPYLLRHFSTCYSIYNKYHSDTEPFGLKNGSAWIYSSEEITHNLPYHSTITTYDGAGYYIDFPNNLTEILDILNILENNTWITRGTRAMFLKFALYNSNNNLVSVVEFVFEILPVGGVLNTVSVDTVQLINFHYWENIIHFVSQGAVIFCYFVKMIIEIAHLFYFKWKYFFKFWKYFDLIIIISGIVSVLFSIQVYLTANKVLKNIAEHPGQYGNLEDVVSKKIQHLRLDAIVLWFAYMKLFKYLCAINEFLGQIQIALNKTVKNVCGFSFMFFLIFTAYAQLGYLLFGSCLYRYHSFSASMFSLLQTILGDSEYYLLSETDSVIAPIFFISFLIVVFFVLLNVFIAIVSENYTDVKTESKVSTTSEIKLTYYLRECLFQFFNKRGRYIKRLDPKLIYDYNIPIPDIVKTLRRLDFRDAHIQVYLKEHDVNLNSKRKLNITNLVQQDAEIDKNQIVHVNDLQRQQILLYQIENQIDLIQKKLDELMTLIIH